MKIIGIIFITTVVLFAILEISTATLFRLEHLNCGGLKCGHLCEVISSKIFEKCGDHAKCDRPAQHGARCVCEDNWIGNNPDEGCHQIIN